MTTQVQTPWGDSGKEIKHQFASVHEVMKEAKLDFTVNLENAFLEDGTRIPKTKVARREDNKAILGTVGDRYTVLQNIEAFEWFQPFVDAKIATIEHAGTLRKGGLIFAQAKVITPAVDIIKGDTVESYITLLNSHTGVTNVLAGFFPRRIFCQNQLPALKASKMLKIKHTKNIHISMEKIRDIMDVSTQEFLATAEQYKFLASKSVDKASLQKYVRLVYKDDPEAEMRESVIEKIEYLFENGRGTSVNTHNYWGAFNAINESLNYIAGRSVDNRLYSLWNGTNAQMNQRALDVATKMAEGKL